MTHSGDWLSKSRVSTVYLPAILKRGEGHMRWKGDSLRYVFASAGVRLSDERGGKEELLVLLFRIWFWSEAGKA